MLRSSDFGDNGLRVGSYLYDTCKKMVILAAFEATLLETKYMMSKMFNNWLLNIKIVQFNGRIKRTPPVCPNRP